MKKELDEHLVKTFPNLYRHRYGDRRVYPITQGFSCGDGWYKILYDLSDKLEKLILTTIPEEQQHIYYARQVKEKFSELRYYMNSSTKEMDDAITDAECLSAVTCEKCGASGEVRKDGGWWRTLCDSCHAKKLKNETI